VLRGLNLAFPKRRVLEKIRGSPTGAEQRAWELSPDHIGPACGREKGEKKLVCCTGQGEEKKKTIVLERSCARHAYLKPTTKG